MNKKPEAKHNFLPKLPIVLSHELSERIENIFSYNFNKQESRLQWVEEIRAFLNYLSNPVIAWGNNRKYKIDKDGIIYISELGFKVAYEILTEESTGKNFIFIYNMSLKISDYGLLEP